MARYVEFSETVSRDEILPAYKKLLTDINYCVNLFEDLEAGKTLWERLGWFGNRESINLDNTKINLEKLKAEIERGIELYIHLFIKMRGMKMIEESYQQRIQEMKQSGFDQSLFVEHQNDFTKKIQTDFSKAVAKIQDTGVTQPKRVRDRTGLLVGIGTVTAGVIALETACCLELATTVTCFTFIALLTSKIAYTYVNDKAKCRAIKYQELKQLSDALHDNAILGMFQAHHSAIANIICGIDNTIETWDRHFESISTNPQKMIEDSSSSDKTIKATRVYDKVFSDTLKKLESEQGMEEAMRNRMAVNAAATACKTFLKETLHYSDSEADKLSEIYSKYI